MTTLARAGSYFSLQDEQIRATLMEELTEISGDQIVILRGGIQRVLDGPDNPDNTVKVALPLIKQERFIGKGHNGEIKLYMEPGLGRLLVLKVIKEIELSREIRNRLCHTIHPNLAPYYGHGEIGIGTGKDPVECLGFVEGVNLEEFLLNKTSEPEFGLKQRLQILLGVIHGALALHKQGLIHRDIKPKNIIIEKSDDESVIRPVLIDYEFLTDVPGYRKTILTSDNVMGTAFYMPPDVFRKTVNTSDDSLRTILTGHDAFSIGRLACDLLGRKPNLISENGNLTPYDQQNYLDLLRDTYKQGGRLKVKLKKSGIIKNTHKEKIKSLENFINALLHFDPKSRTTLVEAKERVEEMLENLE